MEAIPDYDIQKIAQSILDNQYGILKEHYIDFFKLPKAPYNFPTLKVDDYGIFTGDIDEYDKFDTFRLVKDTYKYELQNPDVEIESFIIKNKIKQMRIDLRQNIKDVFNTHQSFVFPLIIASNSAVYDTLYLTDYLLKHIYRILMAMIIHGADDELIKQQTHMISMRELEGKYNVSNVEFNYGFLRIIDLISEFIKDNELDKKQAEYKAEYLQQKSSVMSASITYDDIKYTLHDGILTLKKLKEKINITNWNDDEQIKLPSYATNFQLFFSQYYDSIKKAFPIYNRLENIYRLTALNCILDNFTPDTTVNESVYVDTYPRSILCSGGLLLKVSNFIEIPFKEHPIIEATQKKIDLQVCKEAFDNGGFICAFAPKLKIRDCYEQNLKDFHQCLE